MPVARWLPRAHARQLSNCLLLRLALPFSLSSSSSSSSPFSSSLILTLIFLFLLLLILFGHPPLLNSIHRRHSPIASIVHSHLYFSRFSFLLFSLFSVAFLFTKLEHFQLLARQFQSEQLVIFYNFFINSTFCQTYKSFITVSKSFLQIKVGSARSIISSLKPSAQFARFPLFAFDRFLTQRLKIASQATHFIFTKSDTNNQRVNIKSA